MVTERDRVGSRGLPPSSTEPLRPGVTPSRPWAWPGATGGRRGGGGDRWRAAGPEPGQAMAASERLYELWLLYYAQVSPSRPWSARPPDPLRARAVPAAPASGAPTPPRAADRRAHAGLQSRTHVRAPGCRDVSGICARGQCSRAPHCTASPPAKPRSLSYPGSHSSSLSRLGKLRPAKKGTQFECRLFRLRGAFTISGRG